jgi:hypothetical protein
MRRMSLPRPLVAAFVLVAACGGDGRSSGKQSMMNPGPTDPVLTPDDSVVYGHSASALYTVDPDTLKVMEVGPFQWPSGSDEMTDIALDGKGNMVGISFGAVYSIDKSNAKCTFLSTFQGDRFNGLSFIYADVADGSQEQLVGADGDGTVWKIDPMTGHQTILGNYGGSWQSSGDLVSVAGATYATVTSFLDPSDTLVKVDTITGNATAIGPTGVSGIWGLGYWRARLFGFTQTQGLVTININTGVATPVSNEGVSWYGAGVTTAAPTTVQ